MSFFPSLCLAPFASDSITWHEKLMKKISKDEDSLVDSVEKGFFLREQHQKTEE
jgi:hypothetical protein